MPKLVSPPKKFWSDDLELNVDYILRQVADETGRTQWIEKRTGRQLTVLCGALGLKTGSTQKMKTSICSWEGDLHPFILTECFGRYKSKVAVHDFARRVLSQNVVVDCQKGDNDIDKTALLFAIYLKRWSDLRSVFHLDKIHKTGFARMRLANHARNPRHALHEFLDNASAAEILAEFDAAQRDGLVSDVQSVIPHDDRVLLFVRRAERPKHLVGATGHVIHGYASEWIILDFHETVKRVSISSASPSIPLEIANRIATAYFNKPCEFENESVITYAKQMEVMLDNIRQVKEGALVLVEAEFGSSPLDGAAALRISQPDSRSIGDAIEHFDRAVGKLRLEDVRRIKLLYCRKRVALILDPVHDTDDAYVIRYTDHRLNALERRAFEGYMQGTHGITVLSTEKRFKKSA